MYQMVSIAVSALLLSACATQPDYRRSARRWPQPMAIAVIGGLLSSTVLSLLVVPVVFTWLDRLHREE